MDANTTNEATRKTQYEKGFEDACEKTLLVLSMGIDFYPRVPSEATLSLIMAPEAAAQILDMLGRFREKIAADVKRGKTEAVA